MSHCVKCNKNVHTDVFECSLCAGIFHSACAVPHTLDVSGKLVQGCLRCSKDEEKRKISLIKASGTLSESSPGFTSAAQSNVTQFFVRPSVFQTETVLEMSPKALQKNHGKAPPLNNVNAPSKTNANTTSCDNSDLLKSVLEKV